MRSAARSGVRALLCLMNSKDPRKELEASLTALLLGELPPDKAFELGRAIEQDAELAKLHERLKKTIGLVRETAANPVETVAAQPAPVKMAEERREKLLQHFKTVAPKQFARPARRRKFPIAELSMAAGFVALLAVGFALFEPAANKLGLDLENPTKLPEADSIAFAGESLRDHNGRVQVSGRVRNLTKSLEEEQKQLSRLQWDNASGATRVDRKMAEGAVEEAVTRGKTERLARRTYPEHTLPAAKGDAGNFRYYYGLNPNGSFPTDGSASPGSRVVARGGAGGGGGGPVLTSSAQKPASEGIVLPSLAQATDATSVKDYDWFAGNQAVQHSAENFSLARNEAEPGDNFFAERQPARTAAGTAVTPVDVIDPATGLIVSDDTSSTAGGLAHFSAGAAGRAVTATKPAAQANG